MEPQKAEEEKEVGEARKGMKVEVRKKEGQLLD